MKILTASHSKTRVKARSIDTGLYHTPAHEDSFYDPFVDYPIHYQVKVQICLLCFIWVTVWSATVNIEDTEAVNAVNQRAEDLAKTLSCTGL